MLKKTLIIINIIFLIVTLKAGAFISVREPRGRFLKVKAFDVGQGDSIMLQAPNSSIDILIDAGGEPEELLAKIQQTMLLGDNFLDVVILTHAHQDHLNALVEILEI
ncbi:MAG: MBL fold metallo-hydrolase, partial [Candidatus Moranbacteria bacterium]|nr:MBL fold metallo-hydrolase [Candidatus Moranbacteria bacterium]